MATVFTVLPFLAFIAVAHPATYKTVRSVAGNWVSNAEGRPSFAGLVLHALVFVIIVSLLMRLIAPKTANFENELAMADLGEVPAFDAQMASFHPSIRGAYDGGLETAETPAPAPSPGKTWFSTILKK